ncbi:MAG: DUF1569 domain-containing protein [Aestuariibacter sp.]
MNRRTFIISGITISAAATAGWYILPNNKSDLSLQKLIAELHELQTSQISFEGDWNSFQTFTHLAQSVEFSMQGYPEHRSDVFKSTVGKAAFNVFSSKGYMKHNLLESIPGAPVLAESGRTAEAIKRLINALTTFDNYTGELEEHFAYGKLSKEEYAIAHVLHARDHFSLMQTT